MRACYSVFSMLVNYNKKNSEPEMILICDGYE